MTILKKKLKYDLKNSNAHYHVNEVQIKYTTEFKFMLRWNAMLSMQWFFKLLYLCQFFYNWYKYSLLYIVILCEQYSCEQCEQFFFKKDEENMNAKQQK